MTRGDWQIHTGPFPFIAAGVDGEMWHWRITDGHHFTAVTVRFSSSIVSAERSTLERSTAAAIDSRGRLAVEACLGWHEPPREISYDAVGRGPSYWGGRR